MTTIYDVARVAGVSPKTVSRVLNGGDKVRESTRIAVTDAMASLNYVPSSAARTMRSSRSGLIGLVTNALRGSYDRPDQSGLPDLVLVQAIQQRLEASGFTLLIADSGGRAERVATLLRTFAEHRVEGVFYVAPFHQEVQLPTTHHDLHTVIVNGFDAAGTPAVAPDDYTGQHALVTRLVASGHRRVAYLTLPPTMIATRERIRAWQDALHSAGIEADADLLRTGDVAGSPPDADAQLQAEAIEHFLSMDDPPTVICTGNDRMALRIYGLLRTRGVQVPDQMSVVGFDDHRLIAETLQPALTTVELPYRRMGEAAADLLIDLINGESATDANPLHIDGSVCWRNSVASRQSNTGPSGQRTDPRRLSA